MVKFVICKRVISTGRNADQLSDQFNIHIFEVSKVHGYNYTLDIIHEESNGSYLMIFKIG